MLGGIESLLSAVIADGMAGTRHDPDAELLALGIGNVVTPFFGGIPATGAIARTATNVRSGARSPVASIVHALTVPVAVSVLATLIGYEPMAGLAARCAIVAGPRRWAAGRAARTSHPRGLSGVPSRGHRSSAASTAAASASSLTSMSPGSGSTSRGCARAVRREHRVSIGGGAVLHVGFADVDQQQVLHGGSPCLWSFALFSGDQASSLIQSIGARRDRQRGSEFRHGARFNETLSTTKPVVNTASISSVPQA